MSCILDRGKPILLALMQHILRNGLQDATDVILTGCSGKHNIVPSTIELTSLRIALASNEC